MQEEVSFTKSIHGKAQLVDSEGYTYTQQKVTNHSIYWRCVYYPKYRGHCPGRAQTDGFYIKCKNNSHIHKPKEPVIKKPHGNSKEAKALKKLETENTS